MSRKLKFLLAAIALLFLLQFVVNVFYVSPRLSNALEKLSDAKRELDSAQLELKKARSSVDSISLNVRKFSNYLISIQSHSEMLFKDRELREAKFKTQRDSILRDVDILRNKIDTISLPTLTIYDARKK